MKIGNVNKYKIDYVTFSIKWCYIDSR